MRIIVNLLAIAALAGGIKNEVNVPVKPCGDQLYLMSDQTCGKCENIYEVRSDTGVCSCLEDMVYFRGSCTSCWDIGREFNDQNSCEEECMFGFVRQGRDCEPDPSRWIPDNKQ